jgi:hypothetical protein
MAKESFNGKILGENFNDSTVIGVTNKSSVTSNFSHVDSVMLKQEEWVEDKKSLGMMNLFENAGIIAAPFLSDALTKSNKIYVNGLRGSFEYDIAMDFEKPIVVQNVEEGDYLGIDGSYFNIKLSHAFSQGDRLTYDPVDGEQVIVVEDSEIVNEGDGFVHTVQLVTRDRNKYFPKQFLKAGTEFVKIGHTGGEYNTQWSSPSLNGLNQNKVTLRYTLGDISGVQVSYSAYADSLKVNGQEASYLMERLKAREEMFGKDAMFFVAKKNKAGRIVKNTMKVQPIMEALAMAELMNVTAMSMMFAKGATITGINGSKIVNEGLYHQLRRGHRFVYKNVSELRSYMQRAAEVIYHGTNIPVERRKLKFKAGFNAYNLVREVFSKEFKNTVPVTVGQDVLPVRLLEGSDRYNLSYKSYAIGEAFLNGIGTVSIEHDPSLDFDQFGDYLSRGYSGGFSKRSWTLVMWDITDPMYSNIFDRSVFPKGVEIDQRASKQANLYIVKPEGHPDFAYGRSRGFGMDSQGFDYYRQDMGKEFTCASSMSAWIPDKGRVVMLERLETNYA